MGNEASCLMIDNCDVRFIMFDGVVRTFSDVLYITSLN